jgi:hypothetical protein
VDFEKIRFTTPGRYEEILSHILGHKEYLSRNGEQITLKEAARSWFEKIYLPVIEIINRQKLIERFPGRTESDLYAWTLKNWSSLADGPSPARKVWDIRETGWFTEVIKRLRNLFRSR